MVRGRSLQVLLHPEEGDMDPAHRLCVVCPLTMEETINRNSLNKDPVRGVIKIGGRRRRGGGGFRSEEHTSELQSR